MSSKNLSLLASRRSLFSPMRLATVLCVASLLQKKSWALVPPSLQQQQRRTQYKHNNKSTTFALSLLPTSGEQGGLDGGGKRHRKRDVLLRHTTSAFQLASRKKATAIKRRSRSQLSATSSNDDNNNKNDKDKNETNNKFLNELQEKWQTLVIAKIPEPLLKALTWLDEAWTNVRWYLVTFVTGAVIGVAALIVPLYNSANLEGLTQPVTLFETILHDLDSAYVEPVDTNKLFETGVSAMLSSLDPYTEFEGVQQALEMSESIDGKYGGVGLVIAGIPSSSKTTPAAPVTQPDAAAVPNPTTTAPPVLQNQNNNNNNNNAKPISSLDKNDAATFTSTDMSSNVDIDDDDNISMDERIQEQLAREKIQRAGIRVVSAFEGYAFDYGLRVGDKLVAVDSVDINANTGIDTVRNALRGEPGTWVSISFERDGVPDVQTVVMPRSVVRLRDVKLATLLGNPQDGIGYIQLSGFASDAGREMRNAISYLQRASEDASHGEQSLQGLVLDLRSNPGGLLTSAVDVASLLVPKGSDIVSAKGRGFPGIIYRSRVDPILDTSKTKLAVLVNGNTASAAEIVSGAVQDLDVGVIVGADRTFGKGLVQNVEELPFNTALKFTVAKYYTPSGRCIQGVNYKEGGGLKSENDGKFLASKVEEKDRGTFYTRTGRVVRDGGGVEADYKVDAPKASALEITLLRTGVLNDFAAEWSKHHELTSNFAVDEDTYKSFQAFVNEKQKSGEIQLEALYGKPLSDLKKALSKSGYKGSEKSVEQLKARIVNDIKNDFEKYRSDIKEDIAQTILARYLPESMLIERGVQNDRQVEAAVKLLTSRSKFDTLLAKGSASERMTASTASSLNVATGKGQSSSSPTTDGFRSTITW